MFKTVNLRKTDSSSVTHLWIEISTTFGVILLYFASVYVLTSPSWSNRVSVKILPLSLSFSFFKEIKEGLGSSYSEVFTFLVSNSGAIGAVVILQYNWLELLQQVLWCVSQIFHVMILFCFLLWNKLAHTIVCLKVENHKFEASNSSIQFSHW